MGDSDPALVLCVDDEPGFADLVTTHLERADDGFRTHAVTSVRRALDYLSDHDVDCVVSDYNMDGLDGLAFLEAVRADDPDLPFVLFTGRGSEEIASDAIAAGVTDYMQKGTGTEQYEVLARRVRNAVERHRAEREAAEERERARTILDATPDAILVSVDGRYVYGNSAAVELYGAESARDLHGVHVADLVVARDRAAVESFVASLQAGAKTISRTRQVLRTLDGDTFPAEVTARHVTWDGEDGIVSIVRDRSDQERRERYQTRYRAAFEEAMDAMVVADDDGRYVHVNRSACDLFGLDRSDLLGRSIEEFAPEEYDVDESWNEFVRDGRERGLFPLVRPDGERRLVAYAATADIVPGEHLSILRDVTERHRLEDTLRTEQASLREMYRIAADRDADFEEKLERLLDLGCAHLGLAVGFFTEIADGTQTVVASTDDRGKLRPGASCPLSEAYCRKTIRRESALTVADAAAEGWADDPAYERFGLGSYVGATVVVDGDLYGTFCFADPDPRETPFTEAEQTFVELMARWVSYELGQRRATERLRRQNERLERFASVVSHDLRNPLTVAYGHLDLAAEEHDSEHFAHVENALDRMERIITDLLYLAREGKGIGATEPVDLAAAARSAWGVVDQSAAASLVVGDGLGTVVADPNRLAQLLENLFRNSVEHGSTSNRAEPGDAVEHGSTSSRPGADDSVEHGGDGVTVTVGALDSGFFVADDGPGIPEGERERVFEQGYSTDDAGTGFGLAIVREIAEAHGWSVTVTESDGGGARFEFTGVEAA